jgi:glucans biosynthesis protein C
MSTSDHQTPSDRLHALDAVRSYALLLGVVLHSCAAFLQDFPVPTWKLEPAVVPTILYYVIHIFRMSAFFLIAGFFARMMLERRGTKAFARDRAKRILLPLVVGIPVVSMIIGLFAVLGALPHGMDYLRSLAAPPPGATAQNGGIGILQHLWFLYYLLIFYVLTIAIRAAVRAVDTRGSLISACDRVVTFLLRGPWGAVLLAIPTALYYWHFESWVEWIGLPAPTSLVPDIGGLIAYAFPFWLGWLLHRQIPTLLDLRRHWHVYLVLAVGLTVLCLIIVGPDAQWRGPLLEGMERAAYTGAYMICVWCWVFALVGMALRFLSEAQPVTRYLADASYWVYLMHLGPIIFFVMLLRPFHLHWAIMLVVIIGGTMAILLPTYHWLVRFTWLGAILNGRRHPRAPKLPPAGAAPAAASE